jgi:(p)ppGpp synthase/HD superfamily hydrolase
MMRSPEVDAAAERSGLVRDALSFAEEAHAGQERDGNTNLPFIYHPAAVAERLAQEGFPETVLAAALLHDVLEHSDVTEAELRERFGIEVTALVEALTEDEGVEPYQTRKSEHRERVAGAGQDALAIFAADKLANLEALTEDEGVEPYQTRKSEHRERVAGAGQDALAIFAADKLANLEALRQAYAVQGESVDEGLKVSLDAKLAVWEADLAMLLQASPGLPLAKRLAEELSALRRERAAGSRAASS